MDEKIRYALPGQLLGTEEEYAAGSGTYTAGSDIYSAIFGKVIEKNRILSVERNNELALPKVGSKIIGRIEAIIEPIAIVSVHRISGDENKRYMISGENFILRASSIKKGYVKNVRDEYNIGDIIRARISEVRNGEFRLTTEDDDCGCVKAFASMKNGRCTLVKSPSGLACKGNSEIKENRKIASDYRSMNAKKVC